MKRSLAILLVSFFSYDAVAQRGHEIQFQTGYLRNWGVVFFDYHESETRRHNYEFDHVYDADLLSLAWHYPINAYLDLGLNITRSYDSSFELKQAESALFDSQSGAGPQTAVIFAGLTDAESHYNSYGINMRVNHLIRSNKYKYYFIINPVYQKVEASFKAEDVFETEVVGLREAISDHYSGIEKHMSVGLGFGVSYPLKSGINIKILEIYDRYTLMVSDSRYLSQAHSLEIRTGISYQFYRK